MFLAFCILMLVYTKYIIAWRYDNVAMNEKSLHHEYTPKKPAHHEQAFKL